MVGKAISKGKLRFICLVLFLAVNKRSLLLVDETYSRGYLSA